jgi:hypothetical protein
MWAMWILTPQIRDHNPFLVSKNGLFEPFKCKKPKFYQDRLGTNIGKALKKRTAVYFFRMQGE